MRRKKKAVTVLMPEELCALLTSLTRDRGTRSAYIRQILRRYIRYMETRDDPDAGGFDWEI